MSMIHRNSHNEFVPPKTMVSLFAGIGGFELAFQRIGVSTILSCEIEPIAQHVLKTNMPDIKIVSDICELKSLPKGADILCAGFPCQDLSTIGIKLGMSGTRSSLITEVFRLLKKSPIEWVVIENVPNMLHLHEGEVISTIVTNLENLGYKWAYRTIDSLSFVPQHRCRVFVVASLHHDPKDVLLSCSEDHTSGNVTTSKFTEALGFYWTEGKYAIGLYQNGIPTLKCGSTIGIPSPPAIAFPNGLVASPDIRDAERFQGFPPEWTLPAEDLTKASNRWKLVGNAVTVDTVAWIANKIIHPVKYEYSNDKLLEVKKTIKWPKAAWGQNGKIYVSGASLYPQYREERPLNEYLQYPCKPLSLKAAKGFLNRLNTGTVNCPDFFKDAIYNYVESISRENGRDNA